MFWNNSNVTPKLRELFIHGFEKYPQYQDYNRKFCCRLESQLSEILCRVTIIPDYLTRQLILQGLKSVFYSRIEKQKLLKQQIIQGNKMTMETLLKNYVKASLNNSLNGMVSNSFLKKFNTVPKVHLKSRRYGLHLCCKSPNKDVGCTELKVISIPRCVS